MKSFYQSLQRFRFWRIFCAYFDLNAFWRFLCLTIKLFANRPTILIATVKHSNHLLFILLFEHLRTKKTKKLLREILNRVNHFLIDLTTIHLPIPLTGNKSCVLKFFKMMRDCRSWKIHTLAHFGKSLFNNTCHRTTGFVFYPEFWTSLALRRTATFVNHNKNLKPLFVW